MPLRGICLAALAAAVKADCSTTCRKGQPCWPTSQEVQALYDALDPKANRSLHWDGGDGPVPNPKPIGSNQPLYGSNDNLEPLYELSYDDSWKCIADDFTCHQATRNRPLTGEVPAFVAWPLNADHVQQLVRFAKAHNLGVSVAGTGHDYLTRNMCHQSLFIRMGLLKDIEWHLNGLDGGSVRVGTGVNFGEIMYSGKDQQPPSYTVAGWIGTVGVTGWSLGGGHSPFGRSRGFGAENLVSLEVVTADGELVTANETSHPDLFWAMRGGGGSTWGVVTALTLKAYASPANGVAMSLVTAFGNACEKGLQGFESVARGYANWTNDLSSRFSGIFDVEVIPNKGKPPVPSHWTVDVSSRFSDFFDMKVSPNEAQKKCNGTWMQNFLYVFEGSHDDEELHAELKRLTDSFGPKPGILGDWHVEGPLVLPLGHWWDYIKTTRVLDNIDAYAVTAKKNTTFETGTVGSVSVAAGLGDLMASKLTSHAREMFSTHRGGSAGTAYHDIPGQACPVRPAPNATALGPAFRDAQFHLILGGAMNEQNLQWWYELGDGAYFNESPLQMENWKQRYWGDNYDNLLAVKRRYDPDNLFWCHNCVGSDEKTRSATWV
jgi:ribonuclease T2